MGWFRGHNCGLDGHWFEPRYDERPSGVSFDDARGCSPAELRELLIVRVYVKDVCRHCGRAVERASAPPCAEPAE